MKYFFIAVSFFYFLIAAHTAFATPVKPVVAALKKTEKASSANTHENQASPTTPAFTFGSLPYSNQWEYDRPHSYLLLSLSNQPLVEAPIVLNSKYSSQFKGGQATFINLNYLTEYGRPLQHLFIAGNWNLGAAYLKSNLISSGVALSSSAQQSSWFLGNLSYGLFAGYEFFESLKLYLGPRLATTAYRHTSSMGGAEKDGTIWQSEGAIGLIAQAPRYLGRTSVLAEYSISQQLNKEVAIYSKSGKFALGAGVSF